MAERDAGSSSQPIMTGSTPIAPAPGAMANGRERAQAKNVPTSKGSAAPTETKDSLREVVETVVFVVVLVLLLKAFVAEAFVIPTGSMAETLYGYQKVVECPKCHFEFPVNCSSEVDPQTGPPTPVIGGVCPNCHYEVDFKEDDINPSWNTGDRVLVAKFLYDLGLFGMDGPQRYHVVVFKYPDEPQRAYSALNYIKRLIGLPGETIAIYYGDLYRYEGDALRYDDLKDAAPKDLWEKPHMHSDDQRARDLFDKGAFHILRKPPAVMLAERRIVYDNDYQARDLIGKAEPRWQAESDGNLWSADKPEEPKVFRHEPRSGDELAWLRYHHLIPTDPRVRHAVRRELITDFMGYNSWIPRPGGQPHSPPGLNWVGDLMLEAKVEVTQAQGELVLELSRGVDRFQARCDLATGLCSLFRKSDGKEVQLHAGVATSLKKPGTYRVRFANFDQRLTLWVDSTMPFGDGVPYDAPAYRGPTKENDLEPASVGVRSGGVTVSALKLWRDTYYTTGSQHGDAGLGDFANPGWDALGKLSPNTYYVQPDHYLCLGDNSPESSDGRMWGLVPKRLLLGRAMLKYYPVSRAGRIQ
jgi:signal peptidase I